MKAAAKSETEKRDSTTFWWFSKTLNFISLVSACTLWVFTSVKYPDLDGVSVYQMIPTLPKQEKFNKIEGKTVAEETFVAEALHLDYCVFPKVFNTLAARSDVKTYLTGLGMGEDSANRVNTWWGQINFYASRRYPAEYNLPYDGLVATNGIPEMSSQYYPPICRCMNKVFTTYETRNAKDKFDDARQALDKCMATQHIVKRQTLIGNTDKDNKDTKTRKFISRHAMLFQLCVSFLIGVFYNMIDYKYLPENRTRNIIAWTGLGLTLLFIWLANLLSVNSVSPIAGITWGSIIFPTGLIMGGAIELMWSFSAKDDDVHRITFMHPIIFYFIISALYTIASIENGVFTMSVLITQVFQANTLTMAYTGTLFVTHGKIWKNSTSSRTGFFLLILLAALINIYHMMPFYPVNIGKSTYLWMIPTIFSVLCYSKILFIDHFFGDEDDTVNTKEKLNKRKTTHSEHLFDIGYLFIVFAVLIHFIICVSDLAYGDPNATSTTSNAGKLTKRLNFAFGEMGVQNTADQPFYATLNNINKNSFQTKYYVNP